MIEKIKVIEENKGERLDKYVENRYPDFTRSHIKLLIENGEILVNNQVVKAGYSLKVNDEISLEINLPKPYEVSAEDIKLDIVYQDEDLAVINKPQGMVVHPAVGNYKSTLVNALLYNIKDLSGINGVLRPGIVHRLDKNTSGLLLIAKNDKAHLSLSKQIESKECHRYYRALLVGNLKQDEGIVETGICRSPKDRKKMAVCEKDKGKLAVTKYRVLKRYDKFTYVEFELKTGRTHQIRVHAKYLNHPVANDLEYGEKLKNCDALGQLLCAYKIVFKHPTTSKEMEFEIPIPHYFNVCGIKDIV